MSEEQMKTLRLAVQAEIQVALYRAIAPEEPAFERHIQPAEVLLKCYGIGSPSQSRSSRHER